jgi:hypothetical protein
MRICAKSFQIILVLNIVMADSKYFSWCLIDVQGGLQAQRVAVAAP